MRPLVIALVGVGALAVAAPVPKDKRKTVEDRIAGTWKMVRDSDGERPEGYTFTITFRKGGEMDFTRAYPGDRIPPRVSPGTFKAGEPDGKHKLGSIDWKLSEAGGVERGEVSKVIELTDDVLEFEDPQGKRERFERVKEEKKR
jgi:hypothetical protein